MLALPGHTSEQGTGNKPKNHLTQKLPYKSANFRYLSGTTCARGAGARDGTFGGGGRRVGGVPDSCPRRKGLSSAARDTLRQNASSAARAASAPPLAYPSQAQQHSSLLPRSRRS